MNVRQAMLAAADWIETNPAEYDFRQNGTPCGTPKCMLGWTMYLMGHRGKTDFGDARRFIGVSLGTFLERLIDISTGSAAAGGRYYNYQHDPAGAADLLRLYADKYHPETQPEQFPEVRAELDRIFAATTEAA